MEIREFLIRLDRMAIDMANVAALQNQTELVNEKSFLELKRAINNGKDPDQGKRSVPPMRFS
ncbi:hypothetical protein RDI58_023701 [Solanum bulbocastanum]|uniref:Uncharacterized protein n=1 Tax=Solanum bulbocastanum TaxID=147425 RepID=A0AAN8SWW4_SOLBU